ncbi:MAG TPA: hypothetical protein VHZ33_02810 [Trebonia sp.]|nr:hypothetical protein [Trebonia sp.]
MTALRFPAEIAVGEIEWEDAREPHGYGHLLAIGVVEVPDGTAVRLHAYPVAEITVSNRRGGFFEMPAGAEAMPVAQPREVRERVTWQRDMPDRALRNERGIWGGPEDGSYSVESGDEPVDLEFLRALPPDSVFDLSLGNVLPSSFPAVGHLAPGLRELSVYVDNLDDGAAAVIAGLTALERLSLAGDSAWEEGRRLNDHALSMIAGLPALESLSLLGGAYIEDGLRQLRRLPKLRHLHVEREGLTAPMFRFAADMPALTWLSGLDEFGDEGPMAPAEVAQVRAMLPPRIDMG